MNIPGYDAWKLHNPADDQCDDCAGTSLSDCMNCGGDGAVGPEDFECPCCEGSGTVDCDACTRDDPDEDYLYERARDRMIEAAE
jgi:hypothetical protein